MRVYYVYAVEVTRYRDNPSFPDRTVSGPFRSREDAERTMSGMLKSGTFAKAVVKEVEKEIDE